MLRTATTFCITRPCRTLSEYKYNWLCRSSVELLRIVWRVSGPRFWRHQCCICGPLQIEPHSCLSRWTQSFSGAPFARNPLGRKVLHALTAPTSHCSLLLRCSRAVVVLPACPPRKGGCNRSFITPSLCLNSHGAQGLHRKPVDCGWNLS